MLTLKFEIEKYIYYKDLPLEELNNITRPIYVIDYGWSYLFANVYAINRLGGMDIIGKNNRTIWK